MEELAAARIVAVVIGLILAAAVVSRAVKIVPQQRVGIVERLGRYRQTIQPGLSIVAPFLDQVRCLVDTGEQSVTLRPQSCLTSDRYWVAAEVMLRYQVTDPVAATYEVAEHLTAIEELTATVLRGLLRELTLAEARAGYYQLTEQLRATLAERARHWGIQLHRLEITAIEPQ